QQKKYQNKQDEYNRNIPAELKKYIPSKGKLIFLEFFETDKANNVLTKQKSFRESIYYGMDRSKIAQKLSTHSKKKKIIPNSVIFTKEFFDNSKEYLKEPFFPQSQDSMHMYENLEIQNYGFNFDKALKLLKESYENLSESEKLQSYKFKIQNDLLENENDELKFQINQQIKYNINNLFQKFLEKEKLEIQLEVTIVDKDFNIRISEIPEKDNESFQLCDYFILIKDIFCDRFEPTEKTIQFNFSAIKKYLEQKQIKGQKINQLFFKGMQRTTDFEYEAQFPGLNNEGYFIGDINQFKDFHEKLILELLTINNYNLSSDLQIIRQKTYEEIFEKLLLFAHKQCFIIPLVVID
ncbi:hypothetical protein AlmWB_02140, partial [Candidatus Phytoplasma phoenicium]